MIGAQWPSLLFTPAKDTAPAAMENRLERALAAAGAVAWEWDVSTGCQRSQKRTHFCSWKRTHRTRMSRWFVALQAVSLFG